LSEDLKLEPGTRLAAMVNGMGATPLIELAILARKVGQWAELREHRLETMWLGEFMTSLEMAGASLTLLRLNDRLAELLQAPADTPALRQGSRT